MDATTMDATTITPDHLRTWRKKNNDGEGWPGDDVVGTLIDSSDAGERVANHVERVTVEAYAELYWTEFGLVLVCDANGPWACVVG